MSGKSTKYQPTSCDEGFAFMAEFCDQCVHEKRYRETGDPDDACQISLITMALDVDDPDYPEEWIYDCYGNPSCTRFIHESEPLQERCEFTVDMFDTEAKR